MSSRIIQVSTESDGADEAADVLAAGGLVVFPTETVYGLAARVDRPQAIGRMRSFKSREDQQPFTVHLGRKEDASRFVHPLTGPAARMIAKGWPGPLTLVLPVANPARAPVMTDLDAACSAEIFHQNTVGLRCPDHDVASRLLRAVEVPVVATSANRAGKPPPHTADEASAATAGVADLVLAAGPARYGKSSTIVRSNGTSFQLVREGVYDLRTIEKLASLRLLFVCTGNTCRSPMASALCRLLVAKELGCSPQQLSEHHIHIDSAGTFGYHGGAASASAVAVMSRRGIDLSRHQSRPLTLEIVQSADHIVAMTRSHRQAVTDLEPSASTRVALLLGDADLTDPVGGSEARYAGCAELIDSALPKWLERVTL